MVNRRTPLLRGLSSALKISYCILISALAQLPLVLQANWLGLNLDSISLLLKRL